MTDWSLMGRIGTHTYFISPTGAWQVWFGRTFVAEGREGGLDAAKAHITR